MDTNTNKAKFIMSAANALHRYGASSDRVETAVKLIAEKLELKAEFISTPTSLVANFDFENQPEYTSIVRMAPGKINLYKLCASDEIVDLVVAAKMNITEGRTALEDIIQKPAIYNTMMVNIALAMIAFSAAIFLKGSLNDAVFCGVTSFLISFFTHKIKEEKISTIVEALSAFIVSFSALSIHKLGFSIFPSIAILSSLLYYLPGLMLTMAMHELSSENLTAGTSRLTGALIILLKLAFGTYLGSQLSIYFFGNHSALAPTELGVGFQILSIFLVSASFGIAFQAEKKDFIWIIIGCFISFYTANISQQYIGAVPSAFIGGLVVGIGSNLFSLISKRPAMVLSLPMIILLVPGSVGYQGLGFFFQDNPLIAISTIFQTVSIGMALVAGSYFGNLIIPPKRTL